jgi:molybdopterin-guanine dinucleotide biosynthesis protein A
VTAAIVLAGGRSTRFGSDKLEAVVGGRTLLGRVLDAVAAAGCDPVVVVTAREAAGVAPRRMIGVSEWPRWGGPCAAVAAGVEALDAAGEAADVLLLPADLAEPDAAVAALVAAPGHGVLHDADGHPQWLLARAPIATLRARVAELRAQGPLADLPARALLGGLPAIASPASPASLLITADIDRPDDLDLLKEYIGGTV